MSEHDKAIAHGLILRMPDPQQSEFMQLLTIVESVAIDVAAMRHNVDRNTRELVQIRKILDHALPVRINPTQSQE